MKHTTFCLLSPSLVEQGIMPNLNTLAGGNASPPLYWVGVPRGTKSFALTMVDASVPWGKFGLPNPGFLAGDLMVHWMVYDVRKELLEGASTSDSTIEQLDNSCHEFGSESPYWNYRFGYLGCAPPQGDKAHEYVLTLFALNVSHLDVPAPARYPEFMDALAGKILGTASLTVWYGIKA